MRLCQHSSETQLRLQFGTVNTPENAMGAWDVDAFGNDDACDWSYQLEKVKDLSLLDRTLSKVVEKGNAYVESPDSCEALAAAEVVARLQGNWGTRNAYTEPADKWVETTKLQIAPELARKAHQAIDRILAKDSELRELWEESDSFDAWLASIEDLKSRINA